LVASHVASGDSVGRCRRLTQTLSDHHHQAYRNCHLSQYAPNVAHFFDQLSIWLYGIFLSVEELSPFVGRTSSVIIKASFNPDDPEQNGLAHSIGGIGHCAAELEQADLGAA
jgi:hypothetical protein